MPDFGQTSRVDGDKAVQWAVAFSSADEVALRESLRRCSAKTIEAAVAYRKAGEIIHLPLIILGIFERFVEPDLRPRLATPDTDDLRVIEDLGLDSLTMMEIVMLVEEVTQTEIANEDLRNLATIGDIKVFVDCRARGLPAPPSATNYSSDAVRGLMPIQAPFLFIDDARIGAKGRDPVFLTIDSLSGGETRRLEAGLVKGTGRRVDIDQGSHRYEEGYSRNGGIK